MKTRLHSLWLCLLAACLGSSCIMYRTQLPDMPLAHEQGDLQLNGSVSVSSGLAPSLTLSGSYAFTGWGAAQAYYSMLDFRNCYGQCAVGLYHPFGKATLEGYGGYGYGVSLYEWSRAGEDNQRRQMGGSYRIAFGQVNFGWVSLFEGALDIGLGLKAGRFMPDFADQALDADGAVVEEEDQTRYTAPCALLEPQLMVRVGGERVKFSARFGFTQLLGYPEEEPTFNIDPVALSLGLSFNLPTRRPQ